MNKGIIVQINSIKLFSINILLLNLFIIIYKFI